MEPGAIPPPDGARPQAPAPTNPDTAVRPPSTAPAQGPNPADEPQVSRQNPNEDDGTETNAAAAQATTLGEVADMPERTRSREVSTERQEDEVCLVGSATLNRAVREADKKPATELSLAEGTLLNAADLLDEELWYPGIAEANMALNPTTEQRSAGAVDVLINGMNVTDVVGVAADGQLLCRISGIPGETPFSREQVAAGLLLSRREMLVGNEGFFKGAQADIVGRFIDVRNGNPDAIPNENATAARTELNTTLQTAARETGMIPSVALAHFIEGDTNLAPQQRDNMLAMLDGTNVADTNTVLNIIKASGINRESLLAQAQVAEHNGQTDLARRLTQMANMNTDKLADYIDKVQTGAIPLEEAQGFVKNLERRDMEALLTRVIPNEQDRLAYLKWLKENGGSVGLIALLMAMISFAEVFEQR